MFGPFIFSAKMVCAFIGGINYAESNYFGASYDCHTSGSVHSH